MAITVQQLFRAIVQEDFAAVKRAFNLNPSLVHAKHPRDAHTPLHSAAAVGNLQLLRELLHLGASCQALDGNSETPLHVASRQGHTPVVRELLTDAGRRSCLKATNRDGATPLHLAVVSGHLDVVQALVNAGARTDMRDRAGRVPLDLIDPQQQELADILAQGRQLTPASANRTMRRTSISPAMSPPPPCALATHTSPAPQHMGPDSPPGPGRDAQGHAPDRQLDNKRRSAGSVGRSSTDGSVKRSCAAGGGALSPDGRKKCSPGTTAAAGNGATGQPAYDLYCHPDNNEHYDQEGRLLANSETTPEVQPAGLSSKQSWQHYSPQRSVDASSFSQQQQQQELHHQQQQAAYQHESQLRSYRPRTENSGAPTDHMKLVSSAVPQAAGGGHYNNNLAPINTGGHAPASMGPPGALGLHYQQRHQVQQQQPSQMGPLRSARAAGPMAASAAAAAATNELARSFDHHPLAAGPSTVSQQHTTASYLAQQPSVGGGAGGYIVSPEASSGLLQGSGTAHDSSTSVTAAHAQAAAVATGGQYQHEGLAGQEAGGAHAAGAAGAPHAAAAAFGGQSSRRSCSAVPGTGPNTPRSHMQHHLPPHPPHLAALAAAVSANARVGPLQQPLQAQLGDLASKVQQLEAWYEAQVELIPEWQKVLAVVQGLKRQIEEQQVKQDKLDEKANRQQVSWHNLAGHVASIDKAQQAEEDTLAVVRQHGRQMAELSEEQESIKGTLAGFGDQIRQLQAQLVRQASAEAARISADDSRLAGLTDSLGVHTDSLAALEAGLEEMRVHLAEQRAATADAAEAAAAAAAVIAGSSADSGADARLAALEASMADLQLALLEVKQGNRAPAAAASDSTAAAPAAAEATTSAAECDEAPASDAAKQSLEAEVSELKARVSDLSTSMCGMTGFTPLAGGAVEDTLLPFMETTSNCLQQHEQQLDTIQTLVPKLECVVAQRAQMCELMQQVAALQTAFNLLTGNKAGTLGKEGARPGPGLLSSGPLGSHKAAADYLAMATNMVKLQSQMGALSAAVEQMQLEWESTSASMKADQGAIRCAWESERSRLAAAEREAVRRLADQHKELKTREDRLAHIREAALAEEAVRRAQMDSEARVDRALQGITGQQEQTEGRLAGLADTTEALREQVAALQAEVESSLMSLAPQVAHMMALQEEQQAAAAAAAAASSSQAAAAASVSQEPSPHDPVTRTPRGQHGLLDESEVEGASPAGAGGGGGGVDPSNPFLLDNLPRPAGGTSSNISPGEAAAAPQRRSSSSITWQPQQEGGPAVHTALAYAEVTEGVCHVNLLPMPAVTSSSRAELGRPAGAPAAAPAAVVPAAARLNAGKKAGWFGRKSHRSTGVAGSQAGAAASAEVRSPSKSGSLFGRLHHRGDTHKQLPQQQRCEDADPHPSDQAAVADRTAAEGATHMAADQADVPSAIASVDSGRAVDQSPRTAPAAAASSAAGLKPSKWKKTWHKLGLGGKSSKDAADVRHVRT